MKRVFIGKGMAFNRAERLSYALMARLEVVPFPFHVLAEFFRSSDRVLRAAYTTVGCRMTVQGSVNLEAYLVKNERDSGNSRLVSCFGSRPIEESSRPLSQTSM